MAPYQAAAAEINALWKACINNRVVGTSGCPTDDEVAAIIERHVSLSSNSKEE